MKIPNDKKIIIQCECGDHKFMEFWKWEEDPNWYVGINNHYLPFRKKLKEIWHKFFMREDQWEEFIINDKEMKKLLKIIKK